jgi:hypothetical protein
MLSWKGAIQVPPARLAAVEGNSKARFREAPDVGVFLMHDVTPDVASKAHAKARLKRVLVLIGVLPLGNFFSKVAVGRMTQKLKFFAKTYLIIRNNSVFLMFCFAWQAPVFEAHQ